MTTTEKHELTVRDMFVAAGIMAVGLHVAQHGLPAPASIDLPACDDDEAFVRVRVMGAGDQQRWLNTVHVDWQAASPFDSYERITWHVRLPETGTRIQLVGLRAPVREQVPA